MKTKLRNLIKNPYIQTILALLFTILVVYLLGRTMFLPDTHHETQFSSIMGIIFIVFLFFAFSLWMVNRQKQWISNWALHPFGVILTFAVFPAFLLLCINTPILSNILPAELLIQYGSLNLPHFVFFYFWEGLVFGIAYLAHPNRKSITWKLNKQEILFGILIGLGVWSVVMFINEIHLQWNLTALPYIEKSQLFWPVIPFAVGIIPVSVSFFFFHENNVTPFLRKFIKLLVFVILPLRTICIIPAIIVGLLFSVLHRKKIPFVLIIIAYAVFNGLTLLLNWQWVL